MTESLDLDALEAVARAATPGPWEESEESGTVMWDDETPLALVKTPDGALTWDDHGGLVFTPGDAAHLAAFDPPTVLALIGRVREAEAKAANWAEIDRLALDNVLAERDAALARAQATEAELVEVHAHFAVQEGRLRVAVARAEKAEAAIARVRALLDAPSDDRGITWWSWIEDGLGGSLYEDLRAALGGDQS